MSKKKKPEELLIAAQIETVSHLVLRDGLPCKLVNVSGSHKGGVLMPGTPVISFAKMRDAQRAIDRTLRVRAAISSSLVADWMRSQMSSFLKGEKFTIGPIGRQV